VLFGLVLAGLFSIRLFWPKKAPTRRSAT